MRGRAQPPDAVDPPLERKASKRIDRPRINRPRNKGESRTSPRRLVARERHLEALELRKQGKSYRRIAAELGYANPSAAYEAVARLLHETARDLADDVRNLELARLDSWLASIAVRLARGDVEAIDRALKIQGRRAALLGLDAPRKIAPTTPDGTEPYESLDDATRVERIMELIHLGTNGAKDGADA